MHDLIYSGINIKSVRFDEIVGLHDLWFELFSQVSSLSLKNCLPHKTAYRNPPSQCIAN